jgi:predicted dehydrogenase
MWRGTLIGAGYFAQFHADAWRRVAGAQLAAVADPAPGKAQALALRFGIPRAYESVSAMLEAEQPQVVDIVTRPESHVELVRAAAGRGAHVICQKPMASTRDECVAMCEACERAGVRLLIHENWRWQPWYRELKRRLDDRQCGTVRQVSFFWRTGDGQGPEPYPAQPYFRQMPRLLVYESLVHLLDTFRYLAGEIRSVACQVRRLNPVIAGEDQAHIRVEFAAGPTGLIDANRLTGPVPADVAMGEMWVEGDVASLRVSSDGRLWLRRPGGPESPLDFVPPAAGYKGDSVYATLMHLIESLSTGQPSESDGRDYLRTVELVEACYRSHETGAIVRLGS